MDDYLLRDLEDSVVQAVQRAKTEAENVAAGKPHGAVFAVAPATPGAGQAVPAAGQGYAVQPQATPQALATRYALPPAGTSTAAAPVAPTYTPAGLPVQQFAVQPAATMSFDQALDALGLPTDLVSQIMGNEPPYAPGMIWPEAPPAANFMRAGPLPEPLRRRRIRIAIIVDRNGGSTVLR